MSINQSDQTAILVLYVNDVSAATFSYNMGYVNLSPFAGGLVSDAQLDANVRRIGLFIEQINKNLSHYNYPRPTADSEIEIEPNKIVVKLKLSGTTVINAERLNGSGTVFLARPEITITLRAFVVFYKLLLHLIAEIAAGDA